jgi:acyl-CoA synthetase (NDP forming)
MTSRQAGGRSDDLTSLLSPRRIAIVGVSAGDPQSWGYRVVRVLIDGGFDGDVCVVHPRTDFPGVRTVRSIAEIGDPELVVICVPAERAIGVVADSRAAGARAVIVFASEFAEAGWSRRPAAWSCWGPTVSAFPTGSTTSSCRPRPS